MPLSSNSTNGELPALWDVLSCLGDAVITTDTHGTVTAWNAVAERLTGWSAGDAVGAPLSHVCPLINENTGDPLESPASTALQAGLHVKAAHRAALLTRDGGRLAIEDCAAPIRNTQGQICGTILVLHDVSAQCRAEAALRAAEQRREEFLATLAHELRNPLAPIRQAAAITRSPTASEAQKQWSLEVMERQLRNLSVLLDDLLDVSRVTRGALALRPAPTELTWLIDAAVETARPQLDARRHRLTVLCPPEPVRLHADPLRLAQALAHLLTNAAKYTPPQGDIQLEARLESGEIVIRVSDNGIGISREVLPHLFELFVRGTVQAGVEEGGLGIGLALTRRLVELHGGRIEAHSEGPGQGSHFTVRLPRREPGPAPPPVLKTLAPTGPRRLLIADDNRDSALTLATLARLAGHQVSVAEDGAQALALFTEQHPEVVLLDIAMPGLGGLEVARSIRRHPGGAQVTLIAITGFGQEKDRASAMAAGFDHHLTKPVEWSRVAALIHAHPRPRAS